MDLAKGIYEFERREVGFDVGEHNGMVMEFGDELREIRETQRERYRRRW